VNVVVSGSRSVRVLPVAAKEALRKIIALGAQVLVGDCDGVDRAVQDFLSAAGYTKVRVYHIGPRPRHNCGFPTVAVSGSRYEDKDIRMCQEADYGLAIWDGQSPGTRRNIQRVRQTRVITVPREVPARQALLVAEAVLRDLLHALEHGEASLTDFPAELRAALVTHLCPCPTPPSEQSSRHD
jgi:adenine-specific DNA-methyltransferase